MSASASSRPRTSAERSPPNNIANTIARSRWVPSVATNASMSLAGNDSGSSCGWRTNLPPGRTRPGPRWPSRPACERRKPCPRRGDGTGLSPRRPVITKYSKNARTAATRRFTVDGATDPARDLSAPRTPCQSIQSNTSAASTAESLTSRSARKRAKFATSKPYARTVARLNPRPARCLRNAFARSRPSQPPSSSYPPSTAWTLTTTADPAFPSAPCPQQSIHPPRAIAADLTPQLAACPARAG